MLYQIEFHAAIAEQEGRFTMADVARGVHDKLVRRHPHVFGEVQADDADAVKANWDAIKQAEKGRTSVFEGVAAAQPSLAYADALQRKAAKVGFDWPDVQGDLLFAVVNVARHLGIEPESALRAAAGKFRRRFEGVEALARERGIDLRTAGLEALDALWDEVKRSA